MPAGLTDVVCLVTGASRGAGRAIAAVLGEAGATVIVTGRSGGGATTEGLPGTVEETAAEVERRGGVGIPVRCDQTDDGEVAALVERLARDHGRLDVLVDNAWGGYEGHGADFVAPFWEQPLERVDRMLATGVRARYVLASLAAPLLIARRDGRPGLVVETIAWAFDEYLGSVPYDTVKAAAARLAFGMARDLRAHRVASVALAPGFMRTERVLAADDVDLTETESPEYLGRAVRALAYDPDVLRWTGRTLTAGELARAYGFTDVDGSQPAPFRIPPGAVR
ncbi:MAG: SDR family NAD(P)-dependent oxidoreductase [Thermoleophilia bacterium]